MRVNNFETSLNFPVQTKFCDDKHNYLLYLIEVQDQIAIFKRFFKQLVTVKVNDEKLKQEAIFSSDYND